MAWVSDKRFWSDQSGAVAATYALALIPIIAIVGLAFDYARVVGMETELQSAADQAALAGATQLDRTAGSMERAITAIQGGLVTNETRLSNDGDARLVTIDDNVNVQIVFYSSRADAEAGSNSFTDVGRYADAGFVQVVVDARTVDYAFTPIVGLLSSPEIRARAVAGVGSALCRIPPLMICNPDEGNLGGGGEENAEFDIGNRRGIGMKVVEGPTGSGPSFWQPGNYGFLDLGNGANAVAEGLGWVGSGGGCTSVTGAESIAPDTETGLKAGAIDSINTRFDIYQNNATCKSPGECPSAFNARKDLIRAAGDDPTSSVNACSIHNQGWHETAGPRYLPGSAAPLPDTTTPYAMGHPRDMCHAVSAAGACAEDKFGDGNWDRDAYFRSHYVRTSVGTNGEAVGTRWSTADWQSNTDTGASPVPNNAPTRYQVYLWEQANEGDLIDGVRVLEALPEGATGTTELRQAKPICSQAKGFSGTMQEPDRRVMTIAVVNCTAEGVRGKTKDVKIATWIDVFLVQPSADRDRTSKSDIYFEVIRETQLSTSGNFGGPVRRDMPYLVR